MDIEDIYDAYFGKNPYSVMDGLNQEGKDKIKDYAKILKASGLFEPVVANIIPFRKKEIFMDIFGDAVSPGTGNFLTDAPKESYEVGDLARTMQASESGYLVTVWNRNTTTGKLHGFNKKTASAMERLAFSISMETPHIKKLHDEPDGLFLISLNKKYKPSNY